MKAKIYQNQDENGLHNLDEDENSQKSERKCSS
ncbi:hypothetical protein J2S19_002329 [Metabacillus malikii]|uniref:Uncharacterized protein n=1 Tax=Metabacillus malikii TaxID=1504265 RepID=A0ABT9ZFM5_9BACI|nr:hypothetical protein [Metabacillus malikii]